MNHSEKEPLISKVCCFCEEEKPIKSFYKNKHLKTGYDARCKSCRKLGLKCRADKSFERSKNLSSGRPKLDEPQLWNVRENDWIQMYQFLKQIGYSLEENIHLQFCKKFGLKPRKRMKEKSIQYSPKDLGLS